MNGQSFLSNTKMGIAGGTMTILLANINSGDVLKTIVMASIGATVSFVVSHVLKRMMNRRKRPHP